MPVVERYGQQKTSLAALPGVRKDAAETPNSEGAGVAQSEGQIAEAQAGIGSTVENAAFGQYEQIQKEAKSQADEVARLKWQNQLAQFTDQTLYDPDKGALTVKGEAAQALPDQVNAAYTKVADGIAAGLTTPEQKIKFQADRQERQQSLNLTVLRHVNEQIQSWHADELQASTANHVDLAIKSALDPATAGRELAQAATDLQTNGPKFFGWGTDETKKQIDDMYSKAHVGIISNLLDNKQTDLAKHYYAEAKGQIDGAAQGRIEQALMTAGQSKAGLDTATEIWNTLGPKADDQPIAMDAMENAALDRFKGEADTTKYDETIKYLREKKAGVDASRKDREETTAGKLWLAASQGASLSTIAAMPEYRASSMNDTKRAQLNDYVVSQIERKINIGAAAESRAYTAESRAYTEAQRKEQEKEQKGWTSFWQISSPATLNQTSEDALQAMRGTLGDQHVNRLIEMKRTLSKGEDKVIAATIDEDQFKSVASAAGVPTYGTLTPSQQADAGRLKNAVESAIDLEQERVGKVLTRDQKQKVMHDVIDQKVYINTWMGFGPTNEKIGAVSTAADSAYVPLDKIPAEALSGGVNYIRSQSAEAQRMTDQQIKTRYVGALQRAYALRLAGASLEDIQKALKGVK